MFATSASSKKLDVILKKWQDVGFTVKFHPGAPKEIENLVYREFDEDDTIAKALEPFEPNREIGQDPKVFELFIDKLQERHQSVSAAFHGDERSKRTFFKFPAVRYLEISNGTATFCFTISSNHF